MNVYGLIGLMPLPESTLRQSLPDAAWHTASTNVPEFAAHPGAAAVAEVTELLDPPRRTG